MNFRRAEVARPGREKRALGGDPQKSAEIRGNRLQVGEPGQNGSEPVPNRYVKIVENVP